MAQILGNIRMKAKLLIKHLCHKYFCQLAFVCSKLTIQWRIQRVLDTGIPVWAPKLCAQIIEKCLK